MKFSFRPLIVLTAAASIVAGCQREKLQNATVSLDERQTESFVRSFTVFSESRQPQDSTKTYLSGSSSNSSRSVLWNKGDYLYVTDGSSGGKFTVTSASGSTKAVIEGSIAYSSWYSSVYPYSIVSSYGKSGFSVNLPSVQTYYPDGVCPGSYPMVALCDGGMFRFKNVCGIFAVQLKGDGGKVSSISFSGRDSAGKEIPVAGAAMLALQSGSNPTLSFDGGASTSVTLDCSGSSSLPSLSSTPIPFHIVLPCGTYDSITLSVSLTDGRRMIVNSGRPLTIHRSGFTLAGSLTFKEDVTFTPAENASNCHIVKPGSTITINAVKGNSSKKLSFDNAALLWQDAKGMVKSVGGNGTEGVIVVALNSGREGNAVIVARDGDKVVWSWHLWVTDFDPDAEPFVWKSKDTEITYTWMDRNLGAMSCEKYNKKSLGLLYQWGRKDPFTGASDVESNAEVPAYDIDGNPFFFTIKERPVYGDHKTTNLQLAIETPDVFYTAPSSAWPVVDWLTDDATLQDHDLWGGVSGLKSVYDPCPEGWIMPASGDCWGFRKEYKKDGKLTDDAKYYPEYPWYIEYEDAYCIGFRYKTESGKEYWFPFSGKRDCDKGTISGVGSGAIYNTRTASSTTVMHESFAWGNPANEFSLNRPYGAGVRCIKETK